MLASLEAIAASYGYADGPRVDLGLGAADPCSSHVPWKPWLDDWPNFQKGDVPTCSSHPVSAKFPVATHPIPICYCHILSRFLMERQRPPRQRCGSQGSRHGPGICGCSGRSSPNASRSCEFPIARPRRASVMRSWIIDQDGTIIFTSN